jgi:hypothetical protein
MTEPGADQQARPQSADTGRVIVPGTSSVSGSLRIPRFHFFGLLESCSRGESVAGVSALPDSVRQGVNLPMVLRRPGKNGRVEVEEEEEDGRKGVTVKDGRGPKIDNAHTLPLRPWWP